LVIYKLLIVSSVIAATTIITTLLFTLPMSITSNEYDIFVDPFKDPQDLFIMSRILLQNTGNLPLTNVQIDFGNQQIEKLDTLAPGHKILVSPPVYNDMLFVIVTSDEGIYVKKQYRTPAKMPGMMGS